MKVVAIKPAFFDGARIRPGAEVDVPDGYKAAWCAPKEQAKQILAAAKAAKVPAPKVDKSVLAQAAQNGEIPGKPDGSDLA